MLGRYELKLPLKVKVLKSKQEFSKGHSVDLIKVKNEDNSIFLSFSNEDSGWFDKSFLMYLNKVT